ncbi:MAG TPA: polysaccharide biosynthesis tyrosine autokinase [Gemmatimonadaceae bacterium]|nr:polysaccharide biosynthesis tyrosine autokinase [Gemmatimonadaceae bacterium]
MADSLPPSPSSRHPAPPSAGAQRAGLLPSGAQNAPDGESQALELREVLEVLRRHVRLILAVSVVVLAIAAYVVYTDKPVYRATAVIRLADVRQAIAGGLADQTSERLPGAFTDPVLSQIQVLQSRAVASEAMQQQPVGTRLDARGFPARLVTGVRLADDAGPDTVRLDFDGGVFRARLDTVARTAHYGEPVDLGTVAFAIARAPERGSGLLVVRSENEAVNVVTSHITGRPRRGTDVVDVEFTANDPFVARQMVNAAVEAFQKVDEQRAQEQSRRRRKFVEEQLHQQEALLADAQAELSAFRSHAQIFSTQDLITAEQSALMSLDAQREQLQADRRVYTSLLADIQRPREPGEGDALRALVSSPGIAANPVVGQLFAQLVQYETARDTLVTGPWARARTNPDVLKLDTLVNVARANLVDAVRSQITALDARIDALRDLRERNAAALQQLPTAQATEARLVERVETIKNLADQLRVEFQKAQIAEAVELGQVEVVDLAQLPTRPIGRGPVVILGIGLIVGLLLGGGAAFLKENLDTAIRRRDEIENTLHVPGLAVIPQIASSSNGHRRIAGVSLPQLARRNGGRRHHPYPLVTISDTRSSEAEAYRTLRTNLIFSQAIQTLRTIVVTSPSPQDGKTTTAANLAVTFAQQGIRVLIVDCDLRKARLHTVFGMQREPGLTNVVLGSDSLDDVIRSTAVENLWVVTSGPHPPNPSELLGGAQMREIMDALRERFDVVVMDTPPVHVAADAQILGAQSDGVLLVLRAGQTERASAQDAMGRLTNVGARVVGAVLNDPDHKVPAYGGYYYYNYYDGEE